MRSEPARPGRTIVVTGASSGIGRAIALALSDEGMRVGLVGRRREALDTVAAEIERRGTHPVCLIADLIAPGAVEQLARDIVEHLGEVDVLVHSAGIFPENPLDESAARSHTRAADVLTRALLPGLRSRRGQVVFVNSSAGVPGATAGSAYAESKQALRDVANRLRDEVNPDGIRVLSVYPGRTATPMQAAIHRREGKPYRPERLLAPEDVARIVRHALEMPGGAEVTDVSIRPMQKP